MFGSLSTVIVSPVAKLIFSVFTDADSSAEYDDYGLFQVSNSQYSD
jgi:hypothetical protein